jgi:hypothetical protein
MPDNCDELIRAHLEILRKDIALISGRLPHLGVINCLACRSARQQFCAQ